MTDAQRVAEWKKANPDKVRDQRARDVNRHRKQKRAVHAAVARRRLAERDKTRDTELMRNYGITLADRDQMLATQNFMCVGCDASLRDSLAQVDHCHRTGRVRGILCRDCNLGLGRLGDDPARLRRLADYLERK